MFVRGLLIPGLPGWLACGEHKPSAGGDDGSADFAAGAAELGDHAAYDPPEAKRKRR